MIQSGQQPTPAQVAAYQNALAQQKAGTALSSGSFTGALSALIASPNFSTYALLGAIGFLTLALAFKKGR
jgi:hypothetical protein